MAEERPDPDRVARLRAWVQEEAANSDWTAILARGRATREAWDSAAAGLTPADAPALPRDGDRWSPWNVYNHVAGWLERAAAALEGGVVGRSTSIGNEQAWLADDEPLTAVQAAMDRSWDTYLAVLTSAQQSADASAIITHRFLGELTLSEYAVFATWHIADHAKQMRKIRGLEDT